MNILLILAFALTLLSCKKNKNAIQLRGIYIENTPNNGRSQLNFISENLVVKNEVVSIYSDTFSFSISAGKILMTPVWTNLYPGQNFNFEQIDENTFKIENLYPSIPESPKNYMVYKK
jgi:hypothetical protein